MTLLPIVESTDLVATVPRDFAELCRHYAPIEIFEPPIASPAIPVRQFWHRRSHNDPANAWLRSMVRDLFGRKPASRN